jgi:hypothetical protein
MEIINNEFGGWPMLINNDSSLSMLELMVRLSYYKQSLFFTLDVGSNPTSARTKILKVAII